MIVKITILILDFKVRKQLYHMQLNTASIPLQFYPFLNIFIKIYDVFFTSSVFQSYDHIYVRELYHKIRL